VNIQARFPQHIGQTQNTNFHHHRYPIFFPPTLIIFFYKFQITKWGGKGATVTLQRERSLPRGVVLRDDGFSPLKAHTTVFKAIQRLSFSRAKRLLSLSFTTRLFCPEVHPVCCLKARRVRPKTTCTTSSARIMSPCTCASATRRPSPGPSTQIAFLPRFIHASFPPFFVTNFRRAVTAPPEIYKNRVKTPNHVIHSFESRM